VAKACPNKVSRKAGWLLPLKARLGSRLNPLGLLPLPGFVATGMAPAKQKYQEEQVGQFIKAKKKINKNLNGARQIQIRIDETLDALKGFKPGPGTSTLMKTLQAWLNLLV